MGHSTLTGVAASPATLHPFDACPTPEQLRSRSGAAIGGSDTVSSCLLPPWRQLGAQSCSPQRNELLSPSGSADPAARLLRCLMSARSMQMCRLPGARRPLH